MRRKAGKRHNGLQQVWVDAQQVLRELTRSSCDEGSHATRCEIDGKQEQCSKANGQVKGDRPNVIESAGGSGTGGSNSRSPAHGHFHVSSRNERAAVVARSW